MPIERFKNSYKNWRWNPFTDADMAVDKEEDGLLIPAGSPFVVQLLEVPRYNDPTSVSVRCYGVKTDVDQDSASGQKILYVTSTTGFSPGDLIVINRGGARDEDKIVDTVQAGVSLTVTVNLTYAHTAAQGDDVEKYLEFAEVSGAPAQSQYRVDYPPDDGEGTGLIEFNQNDAEKEFRVNYKATGSPALEETLDTKVSYPAGDPVDNQILRFASGAPAWRYNPIRYFHEGQVIYNAGGEDESCLLFRFKRGADEKKVILELKGAKLHQGYYSELFQHNHGVGSLVNAAASNHTHGVGTYTIPAASNHTHGNGTLDADDVGTHTHAKGTLAGSQPTHQHTDGTLAGTQPNHTHGYGTIAVVAVGTHTHTDGSLVGSQPAHSHGLTGATAEGSNHSHVINNRSHRHADVTSGGSQTEFANGCSSPTATEGSHTHNKGTLTVGSKSGDAVTITGSVAAGGDHGHSLTGATASDGNDAVAIAGSVAAGGNDAVAIAGSTAAGGNHGHNISGSTAAAGAHNHVISGATASGGSHNHAISGSTANTGVTAKGYPNSLKVYINGVDKTTEVLALTGLTQFGNGGSGHAFVTTGSGEMDISSLVSAAQFHELKITEPNSGNGGRCLLHLELY